MPAAGRSPANGSTGPVPPSATSTTIRSSPVQTRRARGGGPYRCALVTTSLTETTRSVTSSAGRRAAGGQRTPAPPPAPGRPDRDRRQLADDPDLSGAAGHVAGEQPPVRPDRRGGAGVRVATR